MSVYWGCVQSLHIVKRNRWVYQKSKYACTNKIPEGNCYKTVNRPFIPFYPGCAPAELHIVPCFKTHKYQGNHLQCAEGRSKSHDSCRRTCEIEMMEGSQYAS